jgi:hypothetical protein
MRQPSSVLMKMMQLSCRHWHHDKHAQRQPFKSPQPQVCKHQARTQTLEHLHDVATDSTLLNKQLHAFSSAHPYRHAARLDVER